MSIAYAYYKSLSGISASINIKMIAAQSGLRGRAVTFQVKGCISRVIFETWKIMPEETPSAILTTPHPIC